MISITKLITDEQLLDFALHTIANQNEDAHPIAEKLVTNYAVSTLLLEQETFTEQDVIDKYGELIVGYITREMVTDGILAVDFDRNEPTYTLTEEGKKLCQ